jgi:hypothetical protein
MPQAETWPIPAIAKPVRSIKTLGAGANDDQWIAHQMLSFRLFRRLNVEAPGLSQIYISNTSGLGVSGLIKSVSSRGLHVLTPVRMPVQRDVMVTVAGCCTLRADVVYCVSKSPGFHAGIVVATYQKPEIAVGAFVVIRELEKPFSVTKGHVMDAGSNSLSILCKTKLKSNTRVRVESNGWVMFGEVELVVLSTMVASCLLVRLDAALPAQFVGPCCEPYASGQAEQGRAWQEEK